MILGDFGPFFWVDRGHVGSLRDHFGIVSASFLGSFWHLFELNFGPFWCVFDPFGRFLGAFLGQKRVILGGFGSKKSIETLKLF